MGTNRKILDVVMPDITSYPFCANPVAVLQCHKETREWMVSSFIQLCSNSVSLNFYDFNYKACPFLHVQRIEKNCIREWGVDIISFIIQSIENGQYVYLLVKRKHIGAYYYPDTDSREADHSVHDIMIYGYDASEGIFYVADNFEKGKYLFSECGFGEMKKAIDEILPQEEEKGGFHGMIETWKYDGGSPPYLSVRRIYESLDDYCHCNPTQIWNIMEIRNYNRNRKWYFGQECYEFICRKIMEADRDELRIQDFHLMWEHKRHLKYILEYLLEKQYIFGNNLAGAMEEIADKTLCARNLVLKYKMADRSFMKERIVDMYNRIREKESRVIEEVLLQLEKGDMERLMYDGRYGSVCI